MCSSGLLSEYNVAGLKLEECDSFHIGGLAPAVKGFPWTSTLTTNASCPVTALPSPWNIPDGLLSQDEISILICGWLGKTRALLACPLHLGQEWGTGVPTPRTQKCTESESAQRGTQECPDRPRHVQYGGRTCLPALRFPRQLCLRVIFVIPFLQH